MPPNKHSAINTTTLMHTTLSEQLLIGSVEGALPCLSNLLLACLCMLSAFVCCPVYVRSGVKESEGEAKMWRVSGRERKIE